MYPTALPEFLPHFLLLLFLFSHSMLLPPPTFHLLPLPRVPPPPSPSVHPVLVWVASWPVENGCLTLRELYKQQPVVLGVEDSSIWCSEQQLVFVSVL